MEVSGLHLSMACDVSWTCYDSFHDLSDFGVFVLLQIRKEQGDSVKRRYKNILSHFQVATRTKAWTTRCLMTWAEDLVRTGSNLHPVHITNLHITLFD